MKNTLKLPTTEIDIPEGLDLVTLGAGCFWCTEAVFQRLRGVHKVVSGYSGGIIENPSYASICNGTTGHAEVIQVYFDPGLISLKELLEVFWATHDPTTLNRQGGDLGPQYRSCIFYHFPEQEQLAKDIKSQLNDNKVFDSPILTVITAFTNFYPAENYLQEYYNRNGTQPYCQFVIQPKVDKLNKIYTELLK
ncbi:peptide-methionine (S)-S-oxide reductase MsrA [Algoriphagus winogradskyi]|uniref:Peptide methionine sulfoxide reductase MsrA n=1 Tax=Algoriphagus winogradskyi TaxID=237017 RepID=A0ABY1P4I8_9BACT|nr:peptide-methionine (S)-S-oxide reductase MsrA [Algoriphagus winogradskyi]SMP25565.1 peptide-methionine (S)-S-oxide reductase [Algoriphagus winogradskyi]